MVSKECVEGRDRGRGRRIRLYRSAHSQAFVVDRWRITDYSMLVINTGIKSGPSRTSLERYRTPSAHPLGLLSSRLASAKRSDLGSVRSNSWQPLFTLAMDIKTMIKEAKLRIVIGIKNPMCMGFATQPVTSALIIPFTVRRQDAGSGGSVVVEYKNRRYVNCRTIMIMSEEVSNYLKYRPRPPGYLVSSLRTLAGIVHLVHISPTLEFVPQLPLPRRRTD
jgi:hypothetical protein